MKLADRKIVNNGIRRGRFFGPCSGRDLRVAFHLFGDAIDSFTFCDLAYKMDRASARGAVPKEWRLLSRFFAHDAQHPEKSTWDTGNHPFRPCATTEFWRRPDGSEVIVELRCDLAQDALIQLFSPGTISAFMHITDSTGEGGFNLWSLGSDRGSSRHGDGGQRLLQLVATRLRSGAVVATDGVMTEPEFQSNRPFELADKLWEPLGEFPNDKRPERRLRLWRALNATGA